MKDYASGFLGVAVWFYVFSTAVQSMAGLPTDHLRQTADKVLLILKDPD
jgi:hypothetical protein